jgi:hypothetical protein
MDNLDNIYPSILERQQLSDYYYYYHNKSSKKMIHQSDAQIIYSDIEYGNSTREKYQTKLQLKKF